MNVQREALRDASEFARAQVFYGEGAGNRRKLIKAAVAAKASRSPAYQQAFEYALTVQDMAAHVQKARKERRRRDFTHAFNKNTRNAMAGRYTGINMAIIVLGGAAYYAHHTGYDKKLYGSIKTKIDGQKRRRATKSQTVYHIKTPVKIPTKTTV